MTTHANSISAPTFMCVICQQMNLLEASHVYLLATGQPDECLPACERCSTGSDDPTHRKMPPVARLKADHQFSHGSWDFGYAVEWLPNASAFDVREAVDRRAVEFLIALQSSNPC